MMEKKPRDVVPLMSRLPPDLHAELVARALAEGRSLNGMLVAALRAGLREEARRTAGGEEPPPAREAHSKGS